MANTIKIKQSSVANKLPTVDNTLAGTPSIAQGELALNTNDKKMYSSDGTNIFEIAGGGATSGTFPFYVADGSSDTIAVTSGSFPFYKADGTQDNIGV